MNLTGLSDPTGNTPDNEEYKNVFNQYGEYNIRMSFYGQEVDLDLEDLYQLFKDRLMQELNVPKQEDKP